MIELKHACIGARCPVCGKNVTNYINRFQFASGISLICPDCDTPIVFFKKKNAGINISISCFACGNVHNFNISSKSLFTGKPLAFGCKENVVDVLFVGSFEDVDAALFQLSKELGVLTDKYYNNLERVYGSCPTAALRILEEKAKEKRVICLCGSYELNIKLSEDGIQLTCPHCGSSEFIPVSTEADVKALMERRSILIK